MDEVSQEPRWIRDLIRFMPLKSQFVLSGNVRDNYPLQIAPGAYTAQPLIPFIASQLHNEGVQHVVAFDPVHGFREVENGTGSLLTQTDLLEQLQLDCKSLHDGFDGIEQFTEGLDRILTKPGAPVALLADFASRILIRPEALASAEHCCFTRALVLAHELRPSPYGTPPRPFYNNLIWIVEKESDLPDWFLIANPRIRHIPVPRPDRLIRRQMAGNLMRNLDGYRQASSDSLDGAIAAFVENTEGMLLLDLIAICQLCKAEGLSIGKISEAVRHYKIGVTEDPWLKLDRRKIAEGQQLIEQRVKGQSPAVVRLFDAIKRAVTGVGASRRGSAPRGVVLLAGPTGVGKSELAGSIASILFGDDSACIRFDMSEFSSEQSYQRLIGASSGYTGYDVGGELTSAIREKPFSVVLIDSIEKAHPRILDLFLQIFDDGVLTTGRGDHAYFSESFIVFSSHLGIGHVTASGEGIQQASPDDSYEELVEKVKYEIEQHFKVTLGRPEILKRIGENIIVFDFIRPEVAVQIFEEMLESLLEELSVHQKIKVVVPPKARAILRELCLCDLADGGRGIKNKLELHFINPLCRALFDLGIVSGAGGEFVVDGVESGTVTRLKLSSRQKERVKK